MRIGQCKVCDVKIKIKQRKMGTRHNTAVYITLSDEGHNFENVWFCNECWKELQKLGFKEYDKGWEKYSPKYVIGESK